MERYGLHEALMETDDEEFSEDVNNDHDRFTVSPTIGIQHALVTQPVVVLNDIQPIYLASEIVIGEQSNDVDDIISVSSDRSDNSTSTVMSRISSTSREPSPTPEVSEKETTYNTEQSDRISNKRARSEIDNDDDGQTCPICLDSWTTSGDHRICSLKCGHLFGHNCITRWLQSQSKKSCPTCKKKVMKNDVRFIYAKKLIAVDSSELDEIKDKLEGVLEERNAIQMELSKYICREHSLNQELNLLRSQIATFKNNPLLYATSNNSMSNLSQTAPRVKLYMEKSLDICQLGGCRVFDANPGLDLIMATVKSPNSLFAGFGLRKISISQYKPLAFLPLHSAQIRDVSFSNIKVLTVSVDKTFKITDSTSNSNISSLSLPMPLWSCCWDSLNNNYFYVGTQMGTVIKYDSRNLVNSLSVLSVPGDLSPVLSVAHIPSEAGYLPRDGLVICKLNSLWFFENDLSEYRRHPLLVDGPFYSMKFDPICRQLLISSRPNHRNPNSRHTLANLKIENDKIVAAPVHMFDSTGLQRHLSRSCFIKGENEYIAAYEESNKLVNLWNINNGLKVTSVVAHDPVLDLNAVKTATNNFMVALTEKKMMFYKFV